MELENETVLTSSDYSHDVVSVLTNDFHGVNSVWVDL